MPSSNQRNLSFGRDIARIYSPGRRDLASCIETDGQGELVLREEVTTETLSRFIRCEHVWANQQVKEQMKPFLAERARMTALARVPDAAARAERKDIQNHLRHVRNTVRTEIMAKGGILGAMAENKQERTKWRNGMIVCMGMLKVTEKAEAAA